jgi:hypothetical protein
VKKRSPVFAIILVAALSIGFRYETGTPSISSPLNFYLYDTLLLVSDSLKGLLVYSVANEQTPRFKARIPLSGNRGMAMKDSIIYANSWGGILAIRLVNDTNYVVTSVIKDDPYHSVMPDGGYYRPMYEGGGGFGCIGRDMAVSGAGSEAPGPSGSGGSYAIFAVIDSFLYYINDRSIITMDISNPASPEKISETYVSWDIETLFPTRQYLFIGGKNGMFVMDRSTPSHPVQIGSITHFRARDPVVVQDTMAYVTLRAAAPWAGVDELMVVNLASITNPKLIKEMPLPTPYGLSIKDSLLYVAQGNNGWTLFGLADPHNPAVLQQWSTPAARDFIWTGDRLFMMCFDRVRIYSVVDPRNPVMLGEIE